jgi:hypothetical protein
MRLLVSVIIDQIAHCATTLPVKVDEKFVDQYFGRP